MSSITDADVSPSRITVNLEPMWQETNAYGSPLPPIKAVVQVVNPHHLVFQLLKQDQEDQFRLLVPDEKTSFDQSDFKVNIAQTARKFFGISIHRKSTDELLFDTTNGPIVMSEQYVEISVTVPSPFIYGFASGHQSSMQRTFSYGKTTLYNRKGADGFHPFYMALEPANGNFHGVFWDNTHPLEVQFSPGPAFSFR